MHHFVFFGAHREAIRTDSLFLNTPSVEGAQIRYFWSALEPARDKYDFTLIRDDIAFLKSHGKKLWVQLADVSFLLDSMPVPRYLLEDPAYHGGAANTYSSDDEAKAKPAGWVARRWDPAVRERFQKFLTQLGAAFDGKIEGINLTETSIGFPDSTGKLVPSGFTNDSYREGIASNMRALRRAFPKSVSMQYANFMPGEWRPSEDKKYLSGVYDLARTIGMGVGGPDLMPYRRGQLGNSYPLIRDIANQVPTGLAVQDGNLAEVNPQTKQKVTATELVDFAKNNLKLDYIFWGREEPYYSTEVIPLLRSNSR